MDEAYRSVDMQGRGGPEFGAALRVAVTVVGHSSLGFAITDGGARASPSTGRRRASFSATGRSAGSNGAGGDEFGRILPRPRAVLPVGTVVECTVPHCDPTINLHDVLHVVRGGDLVDLWRVEARGRAD